MSTENTATPHVGPTRTRYKAVYLLLAIANAVVLGDAQSTFVLTDLGTLGGNSFALAVNNSGMVVGSSTVAGPNDYRPFVWTQAGGMVDLGTLGEDSYAVAVNDNGMVVGFSALPGGDFDHAFVWTQAGGMVDLGTLGGNSRAVAINNNEMVVGVSDTLDGESTSEPHAFVWTQAGGMVDLGTLGGSYSFARAVNDSGMVVGSSGTLGDASQHAFAWTETVGMVDLGTLGGDRSFAYAVNENGMVVGVSDTLDGESTSEHAFVWTQAGGMVDLGTLGGRDSVAVALNDSGMVVGGSFTPEDTDSHAFVWTQAGGMVDLGTLGGNHSGAGAVNGNGMVVGSSNTAEDTSDQAFVWTQAGGMVALDTLGNDSSAANAVNDTGIVVGFSALPGDGTSYHAARWVSEGVAYNTAAGANVEVQLGEVTPVLITFAAVTEPGTTSLTTGTTGPALPVGFVLGNPGVFYELTSTAVFSGTIAVCIDYSGITFTASPALYHYEGGTWEDRTISVNTVANIICGSVTSLSPFAILQPHVPVSASDCKKNSWVSFRRRDGTSFKNQGGCVSYVNTGR